MRNLGNQRGGSKMSDGCTDVYRDDEKANVVYWIRKNEEKFRGKKVPKETAKELIRLWKKFKDIRRGYWTNENTGFANYMIERYTELIETGKTEFEFKKSRGLNGIYEIED